MRTRLLRGTVAAFVFSVVAGLGVSAADESAVVARGRGRFAIRSESGGRITDYRADGEPVGFANVETTRLALLALEPALAR